MFQKNPCCRLLFKTNSDIHIYTNFNVEISHCFLKELLLCFFFLPICLVITVDSGPASTHFLYTLFSRCLTTSWFARLASRNPSNSLTLPPPSSCETRPLKSEESSLQSHMTVWDFCLQCSVVSLRFICTLKFCQLKE